MTVLLDANVLIALVIPSHTHHDTADMWLSEHDGSFATCPLTEGSLTRLVIRHGGTAADAAALLAAVAADRRHTFWPDSISYAEVPLTGVIGHRQVTDAYLAHLARVNEGRLVTFDRGLAAAHGDVADWLPVVPLPRP